MSNPISATRQLQDMANNGLPLTPGQRAFLKLLEGFAVAGLVAAGGIAASLIGSGSVDLLAMGRAALAAFAVAFIMAAVKYYKAHGDSQQQAVATALDPLTQQVISGLTKWGNLPSDTPEETPTPELATLHPDMKTPDDEPAPSV